MTTLIEIPYDIIQNILTNQLSEIRMTGRLSCICRHFRNMLSDNVDTLIDESIKDKFPYLLKIIKINNIKNTDINLDKLEKLLYNLHKVSCLPKGRKYQYLLVGCYNSTLFRIKNDRFILTPTRGTELYQLEQRTLSLLTSLFNYVKLILPKTKTDLDFWVLYPLFEYSILNMEDSYRKNDNIFEDGYLLKDKAREIRHEMKFINASYDIKYRMMKLLNYIDPELSSDDDADY